MLSRRTLCFKIDDESDIPNHRLTGSSFPRNKQHGIGIEVNAWSLKARGFQQVLSRNWSTQVCGSKHSSPWRPLTCAHSTCAQSGPVYFCFPSRQLAEALSKSVPQQYVFLSLPFFLRLSLFLARSFFSVRVHCCTVRRKQISKGDACRNVSQLISCWRNMVVIKRAFSLYGAHSKTSGVAQSSNGKVAVTEYLTTTCQLAWLFGGYSYRTITVFRIYTYPITAKIN